MKQPGFMVWLRSFYALKIPGFRQDSIFSSFLFISGLRWSMKHLSGNKCAVPMGKASFMLPVRFCEGIQVPALAVAIVRLLHQEEAHLQASSVHCSWQVWLEEWALQHGRKKCGFIQTYVKWIPKERHLWKTSKFLMFELLGNRGMIKSIG